MSKQILVVEDEQSLALLLEAFLEEIGFGVLVAGNGQEAVGLLKESIIPLDLIISDIMMPLMDGYLLVKEIKLNPKYAAIPIILVSAARVDLKKLHPHTAEVYLTKPYDLDRFEKEIYRLTK